MSLRIFLLIIVSIVFIPSYAPAFEGFVQTVDKTGTVSWGNGEIVVSGEVVKKDKAEAASPMAVRKAVTLARKQMLDMLMSIRIDGKQTVSAYLAGESAIASQVRGLIQNSFFQGPKPFDAVGHIQVSEQLRGALAELILPTTLQFQSGIPPKLATSTKEGLSLSDDNAPEEVGSGTRGYTGVVIDARGLQITPALVPTIYGQDGFGAYGSFVVSRTNTVNRGLVAYAVTDDPAELRERVGIRPLQVKASGVYGPWRTDLIVPSADARLIRAIAKKGIIAEGCRVVIVVDAPATPPNDESDQAPALEEMGVNDNA